MIIKDNTRISTIVLVMTLLLCITVIVAVSLGAVNIKPDHVGKILINKMLSKDVFEAEWKKSAEGIVWNLRMPRVIMAFVVGAGLALCGILMQAITKNVLADPYILGISSGASAGAVSVIVLGSSLPIVLTPTIGAFIGSLLACVLVFSFALNNKSYNINKLILIGVSMSALLISFTNFLIFTAKEYSQVKNAIFWMTGSLAGAKWNNILLPSIGVIIVFVFIIVLSRPLDIYLLGDTTARNLGVNTKYLSKMIIVLASGLTAILVSMTGIIGFVGLVIPHMCRSLVGSSHRRLAVLSFYIGGIILIWADLFSRIIAKPEEIPIGVLTSLIGAPFFIYLIRRERYTFGKDD